MCDLDLFVFNIGTSLRELFPDNYFTVGEHVRLGPGFGLLYALVYALVTCTDKKKAPAEFANFYGPEDPGLAFLDPAIFDRLWPLTQRAHKIVDLEWSRVKRIARKLVEDGSICEAEIESIMLNR
jgi:hypothetical protein